MSKYYDLLEVNKDASEEEIKKAFRKQAVKHHPDKGGDSEKFKEIAQAYETLSDAQKRRMYDQLGDSGYESSQKGGGSRNPFEGGGFHPFENMHGGDPFNIFEQMFGFGRGQQQNQAAQELIQHKIKITLEEVFAGTQKNIRIMSPKDCSRCKQTCTICKGSGHIEQVLQMGFINQVIRRECHGCNGKGVTSKTPSPDCNECKGAGSTQKEEHFIISLLAGTSHGAQQVVRTGSHNILFTVEVLPHNVFTRQGNDLIMKTSITVGESILGKKIPIPIFDDKGYVMDTSSYGILLNGQKVTIQGKGILDAETNRRGDLIVIIEVKSPNTNRNPISESALQELRVAFEKAGIA